MIRSQPKPPRTRRAFANGWGELDYLCEKIRYWLYKRKQKVSAERYADRVVRILRELPENNVAIIREEAWALVCELTGRLREAIAYREREISLMERLHAEAHSGSYAETTRAYMLRDRSTADLQNRRAILKALQREDAANHKQHRRQNSVEAVDTR